MVENIVFVILVILAAGSGVWVWWTECHGSSPKKPSKPTDEQKDK